MLQDSTQAIPNAQAEQSLGQELTSLAISKTKLKLLQAATKLFFLKGIRAVTMDDIARQTGASKRTLYLHFPDKEALVLELMRLAMAEDEASIAAIRAKKLHPIEELLWVSQLLSESLSEVNPILFHDLKRYHHAAWEEFGLFKERNVIPHVLDVISRGQATGDFRPDLDITVMMRLRMLELDLGFDVEIFPPYGFKMADVQIQLMLHFLYGLCTSKGAKTVDRFRAKLLKHPPQLNGQLTSVMCQ